MLVLIVADDLTGALDSAVTLAAAGLRAVVARRPDDIAAALADDPEVLAVSTASREGSPEAAHAAVTAVFAALPERPRFPFKKIDSRLKGHIAAEIEAMAAVLGFKRVLVAPGIPAQGRTVYRGILMGTGIQQPLDVASAALCGLSLDVPVTITDADLDAAVDFAVTHKPPLLLVGAAGLAAALARRLAPGRRPPAPLHRLMAPLMMAIGSRDPITLLQADRLDGVPTLPAPGGQVTAAPPEARVLLVQLVSGPEKLDASEAGARFAASVAALVDEMRPGTLLACGGETADAILGRLGVGTLEVVGELLPGVPVSRMVVDGRPMLLATKSGGFGGPDTLLSVVEAVGPGRM